MILKIWRFGQNCIPLHTCLFNYHLTDFTPLRISISGRALFIVFCFSTFICQFANSQRIGFGPKIGGNASFFRGDLPVSGMRGLKLGYSIGGYLNIKFEKNKRWQVDINAMYTTRGNHSKFFNTIDLDDNNDAYETEYKYSIGYLEFPILFKYMLNKSGVTRPFFMFGPTYSGIMNASVTDLNVSNSGKEKKLNAKDWIKRDDFGLTVGYGIQWFFINHWYHVDIRYYHGFINVSDNLTNDLKPFISGFSTQVISPYYNSTISITMGVSLERPNNYFLK